MPKLREVTTHIVEGDENPQVTITVRDQPGQGGACHEYLIATPHDPEGIRQGSQIHFQNGPIGEYGPNGITQEALLAVVIDRLESFQNGPFASPFNATALESCKAALDALQQRTRDRIKRGVEGKNVK